MVTCAPGDTDPTPTHAIDKSRTLAEMWKKIKAFRESIPVASAEDQPALTYYDGIRSGLAWAGSLIIDEMNKLPAEQK